MNPETDFRPGLEQLADHYKDILTLLGEDPEREGLVKTPMRVAKAMQTLTRGYTQDPKKVLTDALFEEKYNQMVIVKDIDFFSMCEHHMQVQERLTEQIEQCIRETLKPQGVMVVLEARHLCMQMRGVEKQNSMTTTSAYSGVFESAKTRMEFLSLLKVK